MQRGHAALAHMEAALTGQDWLAGDAVSLADVALVAYTRVAGEGGFELEFYPAVRAWIARVEAALGIS
jgi:glutathione S-transferase